MEGLVSHRRVVGAGHSGSSRLISDKGIIKRSSAGPHFKAGRVVGVEKRHVGVGESHFHDRNVVNRAVKVGAGGEFEIGGGGSGDKLGHRSNVGGDICAGNTSHFGSDGSDG